MLIDAHVEAMEEAIASNLWPGAVARDFLGYGISRDFHGDIEYLYAVYPEELKVYKTRDDNPDNWRLAEVISLKQKPKEIKTKVVRI